MVLNEENCELLKSHGYRYLVVQKKLNIIRDKSEDLKHAVFVYFGFIMSDVLEGFEVIDTEVGRSDSVMTVMGNMLKFNKPTVLLIS